MRERRLSNNLPIRFLELFCADRRVVAVWKSTAVLEMPGLCLAPM